PPSILVDHDQLARLSRLLYPHTRFEIRRVQYASPGFADLAGLDSAVGHVKDLLIHVIEHRSSRPPVLSSDRAALEKQLSRFDNARQFVLLAVELGYSAQDFGNLVRFVDATQDAIVAAVEKHKLVGAMLVADSA